MVEEKEAVFVVDYAVGLGGCVGKEEEDLAAVEIFF